VLFFIGVLIGGRGSILGPLLGTILLTVLPEFAAPLVAWSTFLYAVLLLIIVLAIPGGIAELIDFKNRRPLHSDRAIVPRPELLPRLLGGNAGSGALTLEAKTSETDLPHRLEQAYFTTESTRRILSIASAGA
jgi:branched-chain amino acid transport system permease protein